MMLNFGSEVGKATILDSFSIFLKIMAVGEESTEEVEGSG